MAIMIRGMATASMIPGITTAAMDSDLGIMPGIFQPTGMVDTDMAVTIAPITTIIRQFITPRIVRISQEAAQQDEAVIWPIPIEGAEPFHQAAPLASADQEELRDVLQWTTTVRAVL